MSLVRAARVVWALGLVGAVACGGDDGPGAIQGDGGLDAAGGSDANVMATCRTTADCDDGLFCNGAEACDPEASGAHPVTGCVTPETMTCDDGVACTVDTCVESSRACLFTPPDADDDGHPDAACVDANQDPLGDDCNDADPGVFPGTEEVCVPKEDSATTDEDCDPLTFGTKDDDGDGSVDAACVNTDENGVERGGFDCDDGDISRHRRQPEFCDQKDNDCDETVDEDPGVVQWYADNDDDGVGALPVVEETCELRPLLSLRSSDCDDNDGTVRPGFPETCDGVDNNCNGVIDERLLNCDTTEVETGTAINECLNGGDNCDENATCEDLVAGFLCTCKDGYSGNGVTCGDIDECATNNGNCGDAAYWACANTPGAAPTCSDIDECATNNGGCGDPLTISCINNVGAAPTCNSCPMGYSGDGVTCTDIDECATDRDNCAATATCSNTTGNFTCACNSGYDGNGVTCSDVDECAMNMDNCHANATCTNVPGGFTCACNGGYSGNGVTCTDINECAMNTDGCEPSPDACVNTVGSFMCTCPSGYSGNGLICNDINECSSNNGGCDTNPMATCTNTTGSRTCACPTGYSTNNGGVSCTDIDECVLNIDGCSANPNACVNTAGSFMCVCPSGYSGNGITCTDVNECATSNGGCDTAPMATCTNTTGSRTCACPTGYSTTDGGVTCNDINECSSSNGGCDTSPLATCTNQPGYRQCTCPAGYHGDGVTCVAFTVNGNGTVTDPFTGLIWQQPINTTQRNWSNASSYCAGLTLGGNSNWRLPTQSELRSLDDNNYNNPSIDPTAFPSTPADYFWASDQLFNNGQHWAVVFTDGSYTTQTDTTQLYVRCVR